MKNHLLIASLICIFSISFSQNAVTIHKNVSPKEFHKLISEKDGLLLDVRTPEEVKAGKIKNSVNINYFDNFKLHIKDLDKTKPVFVYCAAGGRSKGAMHKLKSLGFNEVYNLDGGIGAWSEEGFLIEK